MNDTDNDHFFLNLGLGDPRLCILWYIMVYGL